MTEMMEKILIKVKFLLNRRYLIPFGNQLTKVKITEDFTISVKLNYKNYTYFNLKDYTVSKLTQGISVPFCRDMY